MKPKYIPTIVALAAVAFVSFSFSNIKFAYTDFYYKSNNDYQRIQYDHTLETDLREQSIEADGGNTFTDPGRWQRSAVAYTASLDATKYIGKITFNLDEINPPNGGCDADLTLQEALDAVYSEYVTTQSMPSTITVCNTVIVIQFADAVH